MSEEYISINGTRIKWDEEEDSSVVVYTNPEGERCAAITIKKILSDRLREALKAENWYNKEDLWDILPVRIKYGVPTEITPLTKIKGVGGVKAKKMWEKGFDSLRKIADPNNKSVLTSIFRPMEAKRIMEEAQQLIGGQMENPPF